jgi:hypothetical protein
MRQRTNLEKVTDRGETIRLEICEVRSILVPRWWDVRRRIRWERLKYRVRYNRKKLDDETQVALAWAEEALEREFIYGNEDK